MRRTANVSRPGSAFRRVMIHDPEDGGVFLYLFRTLDESPCEADYWYESVTDALRDAEDGFEIGADDRRTIPDPAPGRPHDLLS